MVEFTDSPPVLDPHISYDGLHADFEGNKDLLDHLKSAEDRLDYHFRIHYDNRAPARPSNFPEPSSSEQKGSPQKDFAARFARKNRKLSMSSSNTTSSPAKISTYAIQSNGGLDVVLCSLISFLPAISSRSLVRPLESTACFFSCSPSIIFQIAYL
jgi:hypothetical protein